MGCTGSVSSNSDFDTDGGEAMTTSNQASLNSPLVTVSSPTACLNDMEEEKLEKELEKDTLGLPTANTGGMDGGGTDENQPYTPQEEKQEDGPLINNAIQDQTNSQHSSSSSMSSAPSTKSLVKDSSSKASMDNKQCSPESCSIKMDDSQQQTPSAEHQNDVDTQANKERESAPPADQNNENISAGTEEEKISENVPKAEDVVTDSVENKKDGNIVLPTDQDDIRTTITTKTSVDTLGTEGTVMDNTGTSTEDTIGTSIEETGMDKPGTNTEDTHGTSTEDTVKDKNDTNTENTLVTVNSGVQNPTSCSRKKQQTATKGKEIPAYTFPTSNERKPVPHLARQQNPLGLTNSLAEKGQVVQ
ncbi:hypothetical protein Pcinc_031439 [Petrolisthes cinctipes]|uniref:Uncharacterized protein n=1 Tax=Petrolisthes cinctipes TaxID=88211 RepID=A0AAE1EW53_PETCI|nr:hypothetical protein Pcinc_031439 [Petrolisthes cinctipes]